MSYEPPTWDNVNFELESYVVPDGHSVEFNFIDVLIETLQAVDIKAISMKLTAELHSLPENETEVLVYFRYRKSGEVDWIDTTKQTVSVASIIEQDISNLDPVTEYEYYAVLEDTAEQLIEEGEILTSNTKEIVEYDIIEATDIGLFEATLNINITSINTDNVDVNFEYRKIGDITQTTTVDNISSIKNYQKQITDLEHATDYEFRVKFESDGYVYYTQYTQFTTEDINIIIETNEAENITGTSADFKGELIETNIDNVSIYFEFKIVGEEEWQQTESISKTTPQNITITYEQLYPVTEYEFRIVAEKLDTVEKGEIKTFTTLEHPERIIIKNPDNKPSISIRLN